MDRLHLGRQREMDEIGGRLDARHSAHKKSRRPVEVAAALDERRIDVGYSRTYKEVSKAAPRMASNETRVGG